MREIVGVLATPYASPKRHVLKLNSYQDFYPMLDCECFEIVRRKFGKNYYDVYCDDEGLLLDKDPAIYTFHQDAICEIIVGNCFICKHDEEGETISLAEDEVNEVLNNAREVIVDAKMQGVLVCEI